MHVMKRKPMHCSALIDAVLERMLRRAALSALGNAVLLAGLITLVVLLAFPATARSIALTVGALGGLGISGVIFAFHHPTRMLAAAACDNAAGAAELFSTALLLQGKGQTADPAWRRSVLAKADQAASNLDPARVKVGRPHFATLGAGVVIIATIVAWPTSRPEPLVLPGPAESLRIAPPAADEATAAASSRAASVPGGDSPSSPARTPSGRPPEGSFETSTTGADTRDRGAAGDAGTTGAGIGESRSAAPSPSPGAASTTPELPAPAATAPHTLPAGVLGAAGAQGAAGASGATTSQAPAIESPSVAAPPSPPSTRLAPSNTGSALPDTSAEQEQTLRAVAPAYRDIVRDYLAR
jgi:hypothetical protein